MKYKNYAVFRLDDGSRFLVPHLYENDERSLPPEDVAQMALDLNVSVPQERLRVEFHLNDNGELWADFPHVNAVISTANAQGIIYVLDGPIYDLGKALDNDANRNL
jgi:hypothetical protein